VTVFNGILIIRDLEVGFKFMFLFSFEANSYES